MSGSLVAPVASRAFSEGVSGVWLPVWRPVPRKTVEPNTVNRPVDEERMPGCGTHLILARRVLGTGPGSGSGAERAAFFTGSVGPDMGYFPGGDKFTSDLAHYVGVGQLVRALVRSADNPVAAAFARGWATHIL